MEKKTLLTIAMVFLAFFAGWTLAVTYRSAHFHKDPTLRANVFIITETVSGREVKRGGNIVTNIGERYVRNAMGWDNVTNFNATQWIALGNNTTPAAGDTKLDEEATTLGFDRKANASCVAWMNGTDYAYNVTSPKFTATGDIQINATSLHWNPTDDSDNNCFALATLPGGDQAFANNDNCTIVWVITWDGN